MNIGKKMLHFKELNIIQKIRYVVGKIVLYVMFPIWFMLSVIWWKENSLFIIRHINMFLCGVDEL